MSAPAIFTILAIAGFLLCFGFCLWWSLTETPAVARTRDDVEDEDAS